MTFITAVLTANAEPYDLLWEHLSVPIRQEHVFEVPSPTPDGKRYDKDPVYRPVKPKADLQPNCSTWRAVPDEIRGRLWPGKGSKDEYPNPVDLTVEASENYDHYKERYRLIRRVETWVYRRAYYQHFINCNGARYRHFSVTLEDLEKGDRFQMRIVWDDGSHRTLDQVMGDYPETTIYIDEPGYLEY